MALVPFLLLAMLIIAGILGLIFIVGSILLTIGLVRKGKPNKSKMLPVVLIILGVIFMLPVVVCIVWFATGDIKNKYYKSRYEKETGSVVELWKHTNVTEEKGSEQALKALLSTADSGNKELFKSNFSEEIQNDPEFNKKLDAFFDEYPGGLSVLEFDEGGGAGGGSSNRGRRERNYSCDYDINLGDESYYLELSFCYVNDDHPEQIGVTEFKVMNLEGYVDYYINQDGYERSHTKEDYLVCDICTPDEVSARRVGGHAYRWNESDANLVSADEMGKILGDSKYLKDAIDTGKIGAPNITHTSSVTSSITYFYEILPEDGEQRYVEITTTEDGEIIDAYKESEDKYNLGKIVEK